MDGGATLPGTERVRAHACLLHACLLIDENRKTGCVDRYEVLYILKSNDLAVRTKVVDK